MRTVTASEANRQFSELLKEVRKGETFLVTSHGEPVAELRPPSEKTDAEKQAGWRALLARLDTLEPMNLGGWTRDELYDDDAS